MIKVIRNSALKIAATLTIAFLVGSLFCGCKKDKEPKLSERIIGTWVLDDAILGTTKAVSVGDVQVEVTLTFLSGGGFSLSQKLGDGRSQEFSGSWSLTDNILSGKYSDGKSWGASYTIEIEEDSLRMTSNPESSSSGTSDIYTYHRQ